MSVQEPDLGPISMNITVIRKGGSLGVMTMDWTAMLNGRLSQQTYPLLHRYTF